MSVYSEVQLHAFWDENLKTIVQDQWAANQLPYPLINEHCRKLRAQIVAHSGTGLQIRMSTNYHWASTLVEAAAGFDSSNNAVSICLFIPSILDSYQALERSAKPLWWELFDSHQIVLLMHELEHAAKPDISSDVVINVAEESRAWAETCRNTIVPLVDTYKIPIHNIEANLYLAWKQCGGDTNSPIWRKVIEKYYGSFDGRKEK